MSEMPEDCFYSLEDLIASFEGEAAFYAAVEEKLEELAGEKPESVYREAGAGAGLASCYYHQGAGGDTECDGCIFGQAFQRLGLTKEGCKHLSLRGEIHFIVRGCPASWSMVQDRQDHGKTWREAVEALEPLPA